MSGIIRYANAESGAVAVGIRNGGGVTPISDSVAELLRLPIEQLRARYAGVTENPMSLARTIPLPPIDGRTEVWAAGVTYRRSREARVAESESAPDVYQRVYDAVRPELFFKSAAWRVVGDGEPVAVRADSIIDVPEPELALVINTHAEIVGYTICDDVSSRSIEGDNPLYLPQAKTYLGGCALGPHIRPAWDVADPYALRIHMTIHREGGVVWSGEANTGQLHRRFDDLISHLFAADRFPDGVVLSTGTALVPELPFTLAHGDRIDIDIDQIGALTTSVVRGLQHMNWLLDSTDPRDRSRASGRTGSEG